ncbi:MAG: hypothetical protein QNJ44_09690 [Rhodobacter sp.]|nr:hypothetical protein [Rhodobacter sp.]
MAGAKILRIYLDHDDLRRAEAGNFNIIERISRAFESRNFRVELRRNSAAERLKSATRRGYSLFMMDDPFHPRALTLRRAYFYPFWRIETSAKRWEWQIAQTAFQPAKIDRDAARTFCNAWRKRLFGAAADRPRRNGFVYVPLQGRLLEHRSFQTISPVAMIQSVLDNDPGRPVILGYHPSEIYTPEETQAIDALCERHSRLRVASEPMPELLAGCDYVVTENSSVALSGYFFHKPALLFARIDFHHIAINTADTEDRAAFRAIQTAEPDYDAYLYWFLKLTAINGGSDQAEAQILDMVRRRGWEV